MLKQSTFLRRVLRAAINAGWHVARVDTGEEDVKTGDSLAKIMHEVKSVDVARIYLVRGDHTAWILAVWQGRDEKYPDGEEIVSDYTVNLNEIIEPLYAAVKPR